MGNGRPNHVVITPEFREVYAGRMDPVKYREFNERFWRFGPKGLKKKISEKFPSGSLEGKPAFIIGGGPSTAMVDLSLLKDQFTIGTNFIWKMFDCTIDMFADFTVVKHRMMVNKKFNNSKSIKLLVDLDNNNWNHYYTRAAGFMDHSTDVDFIYHGSNTGFMAVQFALALKANPIYLIGIDFDIHEGKGHCFDEWGESGKYDRVLDRFNKEFKLFCQYFLNGTNIINLSPISATRKYLPTQNYYEVLNGK
jgi:hypothetical protein